METDNIKKGLDIALASVGFMNPTQGYIIILEAEDKGNGFEWTDGAVVDYCDRKHDYLEWTGLYADFTEPRREQTMMSKEESIRTWCGLTVIGKEDNKMEIEELETIVYDEKLMVAHYMLAEAYHGIDKSRAHEHFRKAVSQQYFEKHRKGADSHGYIITFNMENKTLNLPLEKNNHDYIITFNMKNKTLNLPLEKDINVMMARGYLKSASPDVAWVVLEAEDKGDGFEDTDGDVLFYAPHGGLEPLTARVGRYLEQMLLKKGPRK